MEGLVLTRRIGECVCIEGPNGERIRVVLVGPRLLQIVAPSDFKIGRDEWPSEHATKRLDGATARA